MESKGITGKKRPHLGVVFSTLDNPCQLTVWNGIVEFAQVNDIHLTAFFGTYQTTNYNFASHFETCFETIKNSTSLDGLIMLSGFIAQNIGLEDFERYASKIPKHLPVVSVSFALPGIPSVLIDNIAGIYSAVEHLIQCHGKREIAFVKGPDGHPEAEDRLIGYKKALEANGITFDQKYVLPGDFSPESGRDAVIELLDNRNLSVDAIVASDDESAVGVLNELKARNILVPSDIAVTGFDDDKISATFFPSISTSRQDFFQIGFVSAQSLCEIIDGKHIEEVQYVTPVFVARQSCGCLGENFTSTKPIVHDDSNDSDSLMSYVLLKFIPLFQEEVPQHIIHEWATVLVEKLKEEQFSKDEFMYLFNNVLVNYSHYSSHFLIWHDALNILTTGVELHKTEVSCVSTILSTLILTATLIHDIRFKEVKVKEFADSDTRLILRRVAGNLLLVFDIDSLAKELHRSLPELSINTALVGLYQSPIKSDEPNAKRVIDTLIGFDGERKFNLKYINWGSRLFSDYANIDMFDFERERRTFFFMPLFFKDEEVGITYLPYDAQIPVDGYESLRINISTAVKGAELLSTIQTLSITDELTGLLNRRGFFQFVYARLPYLFRNTDIVPIVMFMDMDGLKKINDTYGHNDGDIAISAFAKILREALREEDIIGRVGGDEFVVFSSAKSKENGLKVVSRIRQRLDEYNSKKLHPYDVMSSIGCVVLETATKECFEEAMLNADSVLYEEKLEKKKKGLSRV